MKDPFEVLRSELVHAAARAQLPAPRRRWGWLHGRSRPVAVVVAALAICGSAAAAVVSLGGSSSQPLAGKVPGRVAGGPATGPWSVAGYRYSITVTPSLDAGSAGWSNGIDYARSAGGPSGGGSSSGGGYPTQRNPLFGGNGVGYFESGTSGQRSDTVAYVLTGPMVAAVRIGGRTIRTFTSSQLPTGDRAAVFFLAAGSAQPMVGWRPGEPVRSYLRVPGPSVRKWVRIATIAVLPLDSAGNVIPTTFTYPDGSFPSFWQAPSAVTPNISEPRYHGPTRPRPGACELTQHGLPGLTPVWGHTIARISPARDSVGELLQSCVDTEYYLHGWPLAVGVLLDARRPGQGIDPLPGARPVSGHPGTVDFQSAGLSAQRIGNAWLVVKGGSGSAQRLRVLRALRISKLQLPDPTRVSPAGPPGRS
jgi:hypothetical protein